MPSGVTDKIYVGWIRLQFEDDPTNKFTTRFNVKTFTHKSGAKKWVNKLNRRNEKILFWDQEITDKNDPYYNDFAKYKEAGFDELFIDRLST